VGRQEKGNSLLFHTGVGRREERLDADNGPGWCGGERGGGKGGMKKGVMSDECSCEAKNDVVEQEKGHFCSYRLQLHQHHYYQHY